MFCDVISSYLHVMYDVPQVSVFGPFLFLLYATDVTAIADMHNICVYMYTTSHNV